MKKELKEFSCLQCHDCCRQEGYVRLLEHEPDVMAQVLGMDVLEFIEKYTCLTWDRHGLSLIEKENGECIFLTPKGCKIHLVKPKQCKDFPFTWKYRQWQKTCAWAIKNL